MVGFRKKSQDSASFSRSSGAKADGRAGTASSGAPQRTRAGRNEPAARSGRRISPSPARGPDDSSRRSLQILESLTARRLMAACMET